MSIVSRIIPIYTCRSKVNVLVKNLSYTKTFNRLLGAKRNPDYFRKIAPVSIFHHRQFCIDSKVLDKKAKNAFDDDEFQNILKDFARDFDVTEESSEILDDIRKQRDELEADDSNNSGKLALYSAMKSKYKEFYDQDSTVIYSYEEEPAYEDVFHIDQEHEVKNLRHEAKRGVTGVYDIDELVAILREENLFDICTIEIPKHYSYADYLVLANAKSPRHSRAVMEYILKFYKMKKHEDDPFVKVEGEKYDGWKALDMGNIVLHIFLKDLRAVYDIEYLWLLDSYFDSGGKQADEDSMMDILQEQLEFFKSMEASKSTGTEQRPPVQ